MSPEILLGEEYDERIDIWAVGVLAYEMIVGSNPFQIKSQGELVRILEKEVEFPNGCGVSVGARDFIERVLEKKGRDRMDGEQLLLHPFVKYRGEEKWE